MGAASISYYPKDLVHKEVFYTMDTINMLLGKYKPEEHLQYIKVPAKYAARNDMFMQAEAYEAYVKMHDEALKSGVRLKIVSALRTFDYQKKIWEDKWNGKRLVHGDYLNIKIPDRAERASEILKYSAMPGTSRHHWGTDIDLNALENDYFESGEGLKIFKWLEQNAARYGFCRPYTVKTAERPVGYEEEKWHWSYLPVALSLTNKYKTSVDYSLLKGFDGEETAGELHVIENYVLGINKSCL